MPDVNDEWAKFESEVINKQEATPKKNRRTLYAWLGGMSIAASLLLFFVLSMKDELAEESLLTAQTMLEEGVIEATTVENAVEETTPESPIAAAIAEKAEEVKAIRSKIARVEKKDTVKMLPAQLIAQVKAYEQNSDSDRMTGIDDGLEELAITNVDEALQGRITGLDIVKNAGDLGAGNSVRLRGTAESSSSGDDSPLIVLNGKKLHLKLDDEVLKHATEDDFLQILHLEGEGQTIKSIRVLKDAVATAVYGSQGWNGVIEITTSPIKHLPDSILAKVKTYEMKSDPNVLTGVNEALQGRIAGFDIVNGFEGIKAMDGLPIEQTTYVVPTSRIAPIIKQKGSKKNQPKSITFKVDENLKAVEKKVVAHYDGKLAAQYLLGQDGVNVEDQHVVAMSFADAQNLRIIEKDAFYQCMVKAYAEHKSVTLSPDMMWLLISQGFARYVNAHSEELRSQLVYHEGKQDLVVMTKDDLLSPKTNWGKLVNDFSKEIERHTRGDVAQTIAADFSTTTPVERIASQITLMESMKSYFNYLAVRLGCGIPSITLQGTPDDWRAVLSKTQKLGQYGLSEWTQSLEPILNEFINTAEGKPNQRFWQEMVKKQRVDKFANVRPCSGDTPTMLDGWILKFFPTEYGYTLDKVPHTKSMPAEFVRVDFKYRVVEPLTGAIMSETSMELMSGFVGALDDEKANMLIPQIGWLVRVKGDSTK